MPQRLQLLQPWLTDVSSHSHGVTPRNCLVFVPSLQANEGTVPVVPPVQLASDQLPYKYKVVTPEPWVGKPRFQRFLCSDSFFNVTSKLKNSVIICLHIIVNMCRFFINLFIYI